MTYRAFVDRISASVWPTEVIMNRSSDHAAVIVEFLFLRSRKFVHFVTEQFSPSVYGTDGVITAARTFLNVNEDATIEILSESLVDRAAHRFFTELDGEFEARISLRFIKPEFSRSMAFNFAVGDGQSYRFEESKTCQEAFVRFGDPQFGAKLEESFVALRRNAVDRIAA